MIWMSGFYICRYDHDTTRRTQRLLKRSEFLSAFIGPSSQARKTSRACTLRSSIASLERNYMYRCVLHSYFMQVSLSSSGPKAETRPPLINNELISSRAT